MNHPADEPRRILVDGRRIECRRIGSARPSAPVLVFLHEGLGSVRMWRDFPDRLCAALGLSGVVYSRLGYGASDPLPGPRDWRFMHEEATAALPALLRACEIDRPILFGHSDGASIALIHAGTFPEVPRAVVALAPHLFVEPVCIESIAAITRDYAGPGLRERLARNPLTAIGVDDAESLLSTYLHGPDSLRTYTKDTLPLTDDRPSLEYSFLSGLDIDLDFLLARRESIRPLLSDPPDPTRLQAGEVLQDSVHQYYILEIAGLVRGDLDQLRWHQDQMGDTIHRVAPENLYGRYVLWATDPYRVYLEQELAKRPQDRSLLWAMARWQRFRGELIQARATLLKLNPEQDGEVAWALFCVDAAGRRGWAELVLKVCPDPVRQEIARKSLDAEPARR